MRIIVSEKLPSRSELRSLVKRGRAISLGAWGEQGPGGGPGRRALVLGGMMPQNYNQTHAGPNGNGGGCAPVPAPSIPKGGDGCMLGYNGCKDTIGISTTVVAGATVDIVVTAPYEFTPRAFLYTGTAGDFLINEVSVANGGTSHFGPGYSADVHRIDSFTSKEVSWPRFWNNPGLTINVTNVDAADQVFAGVLIGISAHRR